MSEVEVSPGPPFATGGVLGGSSPLTQIEVARAAAEVAAAVQVAQMCPRDRAKALRLLLEECEQTTLAERAFFRFPRGKSIVTGPSIHFARTAARCWGNMQHSVVELSRDKTKKESVMIAWAWDVETNTRASIGFVQEWKRDAEMGREATELTQLRDVYENNANMGARRLRETILAVIPVYVRQEALDRCRQTIERGGGVALPHRINMIVEAFGGMGITVPQLEEKLGRKAADWSAPDVAQLTVIGKSLRDGETTKEDEFPQQRVTPEEITRQRGRRKPPPTEGEQTDADATGSDTDAGGVGTS